MSETPEVEVADATGHEDELVQTVFPPDEFPDPPQTAADLGNGGSEVPA